MCNAEFLVKRFIPLHCAMCAAATVPCWHVCVCVCVCVLLNTLARVQEVESQLDELSKSSGVSLLLHNISMAGTQCAYSCIASAPHIDVCGCTSYTYIHTHVLPRNCAQGYVIFPFLQAKLASTFVYS
jgi:hypothetical protein